MVLDNGHGVFIVGTINTDIISGDVRVFISTTVIIIELRILEARNGVEAIIIVNIHLICPSDGLCPLFRTVGFNNISTYVAEIISGVHWSGGNALHQLVLRKVNIVIFAWIPMAWRSHNNLIQGN